MRRAALLIPVVLAMLATPVLAEPRDTLRIEMTEFAFSPAVIRVAFGRPARLSFINRGQIAHQFESDVLRKVAVSVIDERLHVESAGLDILRLAPRASARLEFVPHLRGRVEFACTIEGHREAGMRGFLETR